MSATRPFSKYAYWFCCAFILTSAFLHPKWQVGKAEGTLTWDVAGYYFYLPAFLIFEDAKELKFKDDIFEKYHPSGSFYQAYKDEKSGNMIMKYPIGLCLMYLPFFLIGHLIALIGGWPADGFSLPYQAAISFGSMLVAFIGLWFLRKSLLHFFDEKAAAVVLIAVALGTNYYNYSAFDYAMPHNYLFTLCAILIYFSIRFYENTDYKKAAIIGVCVGLAALTRPTDIVFAIFPVLFAFTPVVEKLEFIRKHFFKIALAAVIVFAIGSIQLIYWKWVSGDWLVYSYQDQGFNWKGPHFNAVWFSYRKGWFVYTPMMIFAIAGMFFLFQKKYRSLFWPVLALFFVHMWIVAAWNIWWDGGGFGQRAMIDIYPALALPIAAFAAGIWRFGFL
ncbi:MAG TPA: glycosyltransferase family 39 protein, partial [Saprospiraceae bacterium]|nr:glycosyltransferase family 39 protein [Saprospiraceae bacterium]